jgi:hypothetical protein
VKGDILREAHHTLVHPGERKMYQDLKKKLIAGKE